MKFSINQTELQNALVTVSKGVATRSTLPILSGVYMCAKDDTVTLQTTNLDLSIQYTTAALVEEEGAAVVPAKLFSEIVKNLPDAAVHVTGSEEVLTMVCDTASFSLKALNPQDFPGFPTVEIEKSVEIPFDLFASMVKKTARFVSRDESRGVLTGVLVTLEDAHLRMVATDSYRLAMADIDLPANHTGSFEAVIAGPFLQDIAALPKIDDPVQISLAENQIVVRCGSTVFINRRLEGNYPNYRQLLPESFETRATLNTASVVAAVKRTSLLSNASSPIRISLDAGEETITMSSAAQEVGSAQEVLSGNIQGENVEIAFNYSYILEGLSAISSEELFFDVQAPTKPGIFRACGEENYLYLVMPVRIS